jgi:hypothetical protein
MALGKYLEDIIHQRCENNARIIFEDQRPQGNSYRVASTGSVNPTIQDKAALRVAIMKWQTEHGEQPFPIIDKNRSTFAETFGIDLKETLFWSVDAYKELATKSPEAAALLIMDYRDLLIEAMQRKAALEPA